MVNMKFMKEFKEFISKGNVMDMAVGIIIGSAFTAIVTSLVNDIIMPLFGYIFGGINFSDLKVTLVEATEEAEGVFWNYGAFIQAIINFLLIALCVFIIVKQINKLKDLVSKKEEEPEEEAEPELSDEAKLLTEIKELLQAKSDSSN